LIDLAWNDVDRQSLGPMLTTSGAMVVRSMPSEQEFRLVARTLGSVMPAAVGLPAGAVGLDDVYEVRVRGPRGSGLTDNRGRVVMSSTASRFPLHTDGYNLHEPPRYVLLYRTDGSNDTPTNLVADASVALASLGGTDRATLREPIYHSARGGVAVLAKVSGQDLFRFNPEEMQPSDMAERALAVVTRLCGALTAITEDLLLHRGDCLIMNNWRMCHGRGALEQGSGRVLLRMWVSKETAAT
jgi:alpha-ketoglutarate-dependent taurine dioxygenase